MTLLRALNGDGTLLWPGHDDLDVYRNIYESGGGPLFLSIWMQDPSGLAGEVFRPEWFQGYAHPGYTERQPSAIRPGAEVTVTAKELLAEGEIQAILPDMRTLVSLGACDLAIKQKETADFYARVCCYVSRDGQMFIEDAHQARYTETEMVEDMTRAGKRYRCRAIGIESVSFQSLVFRLATKGSHLPFVELDPQRFDKVIRARPVAARYQAMKVFHLHNSPWRQKFEYQLMSFPGGAHDDLVDGLAYAHELAVKHSSGDFKDLTEIQRSMRRQGDLAVDHVLPPAERAL